MPRKSDREAECAADDKGGMGAARWIAVALVLVVASAIVALGWLLMKAYPPLAPLVAIGAVVLSIAGLLGWPRGRS